MSILISTEFDELNSMLNSRFFQGFTVSRRGSFNLYRFINYSVNRQSDIKFLTVKIRRKGMNFISARYDGRIVNNVSDLIDAIDGKTDK